jgi:hypothetical protein
MKKPEAHVSYLVFRLSSGMEVLKGNRDAILEDDEHVEC